MQYADTETSVGPGSLQCALDVDVAHYVNNKILDRPLVARISRRSQYPDLVLIPVAVYLSLRQTPGILTDHHRKPRTIESKHVG